MGKNTTFHKFQEKTCSSATKSHAAGFGHVEFFSCAGSTSPSHSFATPGGDTLSVANTSTRSTCWRRHHVNSRESMGTCVANSERVGEVTSVGWWGRVHFFLGKGMYTMVSANVKSVVWVGDLDSERDPLMKGIVTEGAPLKSQTTNPNHQFICH